MPDVQEVFRMATQKVDQDPGALDRQVSKQRLAARNRRNAALAVVGVIVVAIAIAAFALRPGTDQISVDNSTTPSPLAFVTDVPIGPQIVGLDGTPRVQLAPGIFSARSVRMSPNHDLLAYIDQDGAVHTVGLDGQDDRQLTDAGNTNDGSSGDYVEQNHVDWSPDGSQLVYAFSGELYVMNADGSDQHAVTTDSTSKDGNYYPVWSSKGTIAYYRGSKHQPDGGPPDAEIYTIPAIGGTPKRLTDDAARDIEPAWSPDGSRISWFHDGELWVMNADGSNQQRIVPRSGFDDAWGSAWSPDGSKIAFLACCTHTGIPTTLSVQVYDFHTKRSVRVGDVLDAESDANGPQWVSNDELLINRYN